MPQRQTHPKVEQRFGSGAAVARFGFLLVAAAALLSASLAQNALAADLPVKARPVPVETYSWTGFYIGANAGGAWGRSDVSSVFSCPNPTCSFQNPLNLAAITAAGSPGTRNSNSFTGGVLAGFNVQAGRLLFGGEIDFNTIRIRSASSVTAFFPTIPGSDPFTETTGLSANWLGTARARVGFLATPSLLFYATGGLAVTRIEVSNSFSTTTLFGSSGVSTMSATKTAGVIGGGAEWAINSHWSLRGEYLYMRFASISTAATVTNAPPLNSNLLVTSGDLRLSIARAAIAYRF